PAHAVTRLFGDLRAESLRPRFDAPELRRAEKAAVSLGAGRRADPAPSLAAYAPARPRRAPDDSPANPLLPRQRAVVLRCADDVFHTPTAGDRRVHRDASSAADPKPDRACPGASNRVPRLW